MDSILQVNGLNKAYSSHKALDNFTLTIPQNSIFGLLGPNGAGKTTFIRLITQITKPDSGTILFNNEPIKPNDINLIGYMPEERGLYKKMDVGEQAVYLAQLKGLSRPDSIKKLKYWFERFEITQWWSKKIEELSKGMQQKVQFIVTIVHEPLLIILDEPFSGFDPINADLIKDELMNIQKKGATIILSTHRMESVEELCTDIALINKSRLLLTGTIKEVIKRNSDNTFSIEYYGGDISNDLVHYNVLKNERLDNSGRLIVKLDNENLNPLLASLLPKVKITAVKEVIPSMNEIFVKSVKNDTHE
ncbi:MAG: ABC transporter ATP-binding protein [Bacteroidota bacterium]